MAGDSILDAPCKLSISILPDTLIERPMNLRQIEDHYWKYFGAIEFERLGLFECAKNEFGDGEVLYLGSAAHITASFIFRNVTYLDKSETSRMFFSDPKSVAAFINKRKRYSSSSYLKYIEEDYNKDTAPKQYDLVFAIFSPDSIAAASRYVKQGGFIIYLPLPSENHKTGLSQGLINKGHIRVIKGKYRYFKDHPKSKNKKKDMVGNKFRDIYSYSVLQAL